GLSRGLGGRGRRCGECHCVPARRCGGGGSAVSCGRCARRPASPSTRPPSGCGSPRARSAASRPASSARHPRTSTASSPCTARRQERRGPPDPVDYWVIVDEGIFGRPVHDAAIMREQMDRLIEFAAGPYVTLQVLPLSIGVHPAMDGTFAILEYDERESPNV